MSFVSMQGFFFDQANVERIPNAPELSSGEKKQFPYAHTLPASVKIMYNDYGTKAWSAPREEDLRLLFLVLRESKNPKGPEAEETYQAWVFQDREQIRVLSSDAGKISAGTMYQAIRLREGLQDSTVDREESVSRANRKMSAFVGAHADRRGTHEEICKWIDTVCREVRI